LADALEKAKIPYAIGGAIALGYWAPPRGTHDVDINVFVAADGAGPAIDALRDAGVEMERSEALRTAADRGDARGSFRSMRVDVFFSTIHVHDSAAQRVRVVPLEERPVRVLSAEDLAVLKLLFYRGKDLVDVEQLVSMQGAALDRAYVRRWLVESVGEADHRIAWWDRLLEQLRA
jgi:hypothetical protein